MTESCRLIHPQSLFMQGVDLQIIFDILSLVVCPWIYYYSGMLVATACLLLYTATILPLQICLWNYDDPCNIFPTLYFDVAVDSFFMVRINRKNTLKLIHLTSKPSPKTKANSQHLSLCCSLRLPCNSSLGHMTRTWTTLMIGSGFSRRISRPSPDSGWTVWRASRGHGWTWTHIG